MKVLFLFLSFIFFSFSPFQISSFRFPFSFPLLILHHLFTCTLWQMKDVTPLPSFFFHLLIFFFYFSLFLSVAPFPLTEATFKDDNKP